MLVESTPGLSEYVCNVPDNGSGTVNVPLEGCVYVNPTEFHMIVDGLPPGTELVVGVAHHNFTDITHTPGGIFPSGEIETAL